MLCLNVEKLDLKMYKPGDCYLIHNLFGHRKIMFCLNECTFFDFHSFYKLSYMILFSEKIYKLNDLNGIRWFF